MRVQATVYFENETPSRDNVRAEVARQLNQKEELVVIKHIYPRFGKKEAKVIAHVYSNLEELKRIEEDHLLKKHFKEKKEESVAETAAPNAEA